MTKWGSSHRSLLRLIGLNMIVRGLWLVYMHPPQTSDFAWYFSHAVQLAAGQGYQINGQATAYWPIGFPFFLSLLFRVSGPHAVAGTIANALLSVGIVVLVYLLTKRLTANSMTAFLAALGYSLLPSQIEWNAVLGSEELFTLLLLMSIYVYLCAEGRRWYAAVIAAGLLLGLATDVRPIPLLFPAVILIYEVWIRRQLWRTATIRAAIFAAAVFLAVSPVTLRNLFVLHHFILISTNGGINLWQGTRTDTGYFWSWNPAINPLLAAGSTSILADHVGTRLFIQHVIHHPILTILHGFRKIFFLYRADSDVTNFTFAVGTQAYMRRLVHVVGWFNSIVYWLWMAMCIIGGTRGMRFLRLSWRMLALPLSYIVYNTVIFFFFPAWDRFRYPLMPLFAVWFGLGVTWLCHRLRSHTA